MSKNSEDGLVEKMSPYAALAFDSLSQRLLKTRSYPLSTYKKYLGDTRNPQQEEDTPMFVTWTTVIGDEKRLRGCIGTFADVPLESGIKEYALIAAFEDPRFNGINVRELSFLECSTTLLKNFEKCDDPLGWELGLHGIKISFQYQGSRYSGTFLPEVAVEQGWTKEETLLNLIKKLGLYKSIHFQDLQLQVTRYQGLKGKISYAEFLKVKKQIDDSL